MATMLRVVLSLFSLNLHLLLLTCDERHMGAPLAFDDIMNE